MLKALLWLLIGALLAGGCFFFLQRRDLEIEENPSSIRAEAERMKTEEVERKVAECRAKVAACQSELDAKLKPVRDYPLSEKVSEKAQAVKSAAEPCKEKLGKLRDNLAAWEEALRKKVAK